MRQGYFLFSKRELNTVREEGRVTVPKAGTPQGGVVSPCSRMSTCTTW